MMASIALKRGAEINPVPGVASCQAFARRHKQVTKSLSHLNNDSKCFASQFFSITPALINKSHNCLRLLDLVLKCSAVFLHAWSLPTSTSSDVTLCLKLATVRVFILWKPAVTYKPLLPPLPRELGCKYLAVCQLVKPIMWPSDTDKDQNKWQKSLSKVHSSCKVLYQRIFSSALFMNSLHVPLGEGTWILYMSP